MSDNVVEMHGREFVLEEPSTDVVIRILNVVGAVAVRAEGMASRLVKNPSNRAILFGLLAAMSRDDLVKLGSAVLQFESDREGRKWLKEHGVKVAPLVKGLMINLKLSTDLVEALQSFFDGIEGVANLLEMIAPPGTQEESGDD